MTRSIGHGHRLVRLAVAGAALAAVALTSACGAGQLAATSKIVPAVPGGGATIQATSPDAPNGAIMIQNATIPYQTSGYVSGDTAPISLYVTNNTNSPIALSPSSSPVLLRNSDGQANQALGTLAWKAGGAAASPTPAPAPPVPSDATSPNPSDTAGVPPTAQAFSPITIAPGTSVQLTPAQEQFLAISLTNAQATLAPGTTVQIGLDFQGPSQKFSTVVVVPVGPPQVAPTRVAATP